MIKFVAGFAAMMACTVFANLLMKLGATAPPSERILFGLVSWKLIAGVTAFGCGAIIFAWLLHWLPLNIVQSFAAAQFVAVILASSVVLGEPIPGARWLGIAMIACGILIVAMTTTAPATYSN